jgi:hypothetical protein
VSRERGQPPISSRSVDPKLAGQLVSTGLEVLEAHLPVVEGGVQLGELRQDRGLIDLRCGCLVASLVALLRTLGATLELGLCFGLLVAIPLELAEGRSPP